MKRSAFGHTKMRRLMRHLNIPLYAAVGILEGLWNLTAREAPQGNIGKLTDDDIADSLGWTDKSSVLIDALVQSGWVEGNADYRLVVHDWHDHADDAVRKSLQRSNLPFLSRNVATIPVKIETVPDKNRLPEPSLAKPEPKPEPKAKPTPPAAPLFVLPAWVPQKSWEEYLKMRVRIRKPMTDYAKELALRKLEKFRTEGQDVQVVLDNATQGNWTGLWPVEERNGQRGKNQGRTEGDSDLAGIETGSRYFDSILGTAGTGGA